MSKEESKFSALGAKAERVLQTQLDIIEKDMKESVKENRDPKYSLTDLMKVMDRILKLEAIRQRMDDDGEGSFFNKPKGQEDEE